jgi:hypothetical protein
VKLYTRIHMYVDGNSLHVHRSVKNVSNRRCRQTDRQTDRQTAHTHFFCTNKSERAGPSYGMRIRAIWSRVCTLSLFCSLEDRDGCVILSVRELFCYTWNDRNFIKLGLQRVGPRYLNRYSESLRIGRLGIESLWGRVSATVQTGPGPTQPPVKWVPGLFPRVNMAGAGRVELHV